jgi:hypothetical protein
MNRIALYVVFLIATGGATALATHGAHVHNGVDVGISDGGDNDYWIHPWITYNSSHSKTVVVRRAANTPEGFWTVGYMTTNGTHSHRDHYPRTYRECHYYALVTVSNVMGKHSHAHHNFCGKIGGSGD